MNALAITATETVPAPPEEVFALFGTGTGQGLVTGAVCDSLTAGAVVTLALSIEGTTVDVLGRISAVKPGHRIVITHEQPWRGRIRLRFEDADYGATQVSLVAELDQQGIDWLLRRRGWPLADEPDDGTHRIGLLTSKSGSGAVYSVASENLAQLGVNELNAEGGLAGRPVRLVVGDDATDPAVAAAEARRLVRNRCRVLIACVTSASFNAAQEAVEHTRIPLVHAVINEGGSGPPHVFRLGERPADQLRLAAGPLMHDTGARHWFFIGNDYCWSHGAHRAARHVFEKTQAILTGEHYVPVGTRDFSHTIEMIERSGADLVLSTLIGADEVAFERQSQQAGLRARCRTLALTLDETTRERIGDGAARGLWAAFGYFQQLPTGDNSNLLRRYRATSGPWAPPVSAFSESVYEALQLYAAAVRRTRADSPAEVVTELHYLRAVLPRGEVALMGSNQLRQPLHFAEAVDGGFKLLGSASVPSR